MINIKELIENLKLNILIGHSTGKYWKAKCNVTERLIENWIFFLKLEANFWGRRKKKKNKNKKRMFVANRESASDQLKSDP